MNNLIVRCPYCGCTVKTDFQEQVWAADASEILTVPVIERIGRIATTTKWESKRGDSRLGGVLSIWNYTVGLLRGYQMDVNVMKREIPCDSPTCGSAFDCYIKLDHAHEFSDFWPHLTGRVDESGNFTNSGARTSSERLLAIGEKLGVNSASFIIVLALAFCLLSLLPDLLINPDPTHMLDQIILRASATFLVAVMIWTIKQISEHIRGSAGALRELLTIANYNSFQFWLNFNLGRVTGVNFPRQGKRNPGEKLLHFWRRKLSNTTISQATLVGGIPSLILAAVIWAVNYYPKIGPLSVSAVLELVFWLTIMYFTGITAWIGFNIGVYVIQNISLIPMKLTPLNGFENIAPVKKIAQLSLQLVIPVALLPLVFIIALLAMPGAQDVIQLWLLPWVRIILGVALIFIGLGDTGILVLGVIYIILLPFISFKPLENFNVREIGIDVWIGLGVFGLFLSVLLGYHLTRASLPLVKIVMKKKQETIDRLDHFLLSLSDELSQIDKDLVNLSELQSSRRETILRDMKSVIDLREKVHSTKIDILDLRTGFGVITPLISSIIYPLTVELLKRKIK